MVTVITTLDALCRRTFELWLPTGTRMLRNLRRRRILTDSPAPPDTSIGRRADNLHKQT